MTSRTPRKFAPVPIEESTKSSRDRDETTQATAKPRRFAPQPVEQTTRSSKNNTPASDEAEKPKLRRFAPEPVEHSTKSSKTPANGDVVSTETKAKPRRFAPQLVDESTTSSKEKAAPTKTQHVKFKPELVATTYGSNRASKRQDPSIEPRVKDSEPEAEQEAEPKPPRKFTPILLDTATRSRRAGDPNAPLSQDYRTEYGYHAHPHDHWRRVNGEITPTVASEQVDDADAMDIDQVPSRSSQSSGLRAIAPLDGSAPKRASCFKPQRQHSFRAPELETIESSESEEESARSSTPPTPSQQGSFLTTSTSYELFKHATRRRESIDDSWQHYLLDLERKKAQERLEEQALAAFPNVDFGYEHPDHYFHNDDDSGEFEIEERPVTWEGSEDDLLEMARRESTTNMWEMGELRRHAEVLEQERNANRTTAKKPSKSPWGRLDSLAGNAEPPTAEMKSMRDRARPPMLGAELTFPRCASPDPARFDVTQGSAALRDQMCYLTAAAEAEKKRSGEEGGLWAAKQPESKRPNTLRTPGTPGTPTTPSSKGLWGGFCVDDGRGGTGFGGRATPSGITGLMTPRNEATNPFQSMTPGSGGGVGLTPPATPTRNKSRTDLQRLHSILVTEREIDNMMEREYPDSFITQVYNYLSLGYPSLARAFDDELSKISRIPISELRQDDERARAAPRGYIRLGPDFEGGGGEGTVEDACMRWRALKRYVREWAKQEKNWEPTDGVGANWGTAVRRGSWGI